MVSPSHSMKNNRAVVRVTRNTVKHVPNNSFAQGFQGWRQLLTLAIHNLPWIRNLLTVIKHPKSLFTWARLTELARFVRKRTRAESLLRWCYTGRFATPISNDTMLREKYFQYFWRHLQCCNALQVVESDSRTCNSIARIWSNNLLPSIFVATMTRVPLFTCASAPPAPKAVLSKPGD